MDEDSVTESRNSSPDTDSSYSSEPPTPPPPRHLLASSIPASFHDPTRFLFCHERGLLVRIPTPGYAPISYNEDLYGSIVKESLLPLPTNYELYPRADTRALKYITAWEPQRTRSGAVRDAAYQDPPPSQEYPFSFYLAQCIHYGLQFPIFQGRDGAKRAIRNAIRARDNQPLLVPLAIRTLEKDLADRYELGDMSMTERGQYVLSTVGKMRSEQPVSKTENDTRRKRKPYVPIRDPILYANVRDDEVDSDEAEQEDKDNEEVEEGEDEDRPEDEDSEEIEEEENEDEEEEEGEGEEETASQSSEEPANDAYAPLHAAEVEPEDASSAESTHNPAEDDWFSARKAKVNGDAPGDHTSSDSSDDEGEIHATANGKRAAGKAKTPNQSQPGLFRGLLNWGGSQKRKIGEVEDAEKRSPSKSRR